MDMDNLRFVIVGCGRIAVRHSELLGNGHIQGAELIGVCDSVRKKATSLGQKYSVPFFDCMHQMMQELKPDVVVVLTPSGLHAQHVCELSVYGSHIVVEKPMALTISDATRMIDACSDNNVQLFVIKQNRFNLPVIKLRQALDEQRFGKLTIGTVRVRWCRPQAYYDQADWRGTWSMDGGVLTNQASHHVDLLIWMMGEVESVFAKGMTALADIETEDTAAVILKFKSGALGVIEATTATRPKDLEGSLSILGESGSVEIGGFAVNEMLHWQFTQMIEEDNQVKTKYSVNPPNVYGFGHHEYYRHVVSALTNSGENLVDGFEGRKSLEVITAIYESIETGKEVRLPIESTHSRLGKKT